MKRAVSMVLGMIFCALVVHSQETSRQDNYETVVSTSRFNSTSRVILDQEDIKKSKVTNLTSLLASQANIAISNSNFQPGSIYLRGGDASHVLILVDGLPFYDTSTVQRTINLNEIDIKTIRRIEILKGSQSVLYGGQALTGVIKIETFPSVVERKFSATAEVGMRDYKKLSGVAFLPTSDEQSGYLVRLQGSGKDNRSPVLESNESYRGKLASGDVGYLRKGSWDFFIKANRISDSNEIPTSGMNYAALDTKDFKAETDILGVSTGLFGKESPWMPKLLLGYQTTDRSFIQRPVTDQKYKGDLWNIRFESHPLATEKTQILLGASYLRESFLFENAEVTAADAFNEQKGVFSKIQHLVHEDLELEAGVRSEYYNYENRVESYQLGLTLWDFAKLEFSTGFKAPSLFQLYSSYGNRDLKPEKSHSYALSFDRPWGGMGTVSFALFETHFDGLITTQGSGQLQRYYNVSRAMTRGAELQVSKETDLRLRVDLALGYQEPRDIENSTWLLRRPLQTGSLRLTQHFDREHSIGYEVIANGERIDRFGSSGGQTINGSLSSYSISHVFLNLGLRQGLTAYLRGNNIFDQRFEESRGFHNEGAFWLAGVEFTN